MGLNIKNDEANRLARELAAVTGESLTTAVTIAVRERLDRCKRSRQEPLSERILKIGKDCALHLKEPFLTVDHGDLVYDDKDDDFSHAGLPRVG